MRRTSIVFILCAALGGATAGAQVMQQLPVKLSWGHRSPDGSRFFIRLVEDGARLSELKGVGLEADDSQQAPVFQTRSGGGDVDGAQFVLNCPAAPVREIENLNPIWRDLIAQSDADAARRLREDPAYRRDSRRLIVQMNTVGTRGFAVSIDQLLRNRAMWVPELDVYLTSGDAPVAFEEHQNELKAYKDRRILERVHAEDEASYEQYLSRWEDMGSPTYVHPNQPSPGHIVCLSWDSALYKFGVDRGAGVRNDLGNPDRFQFDFDFGRLGRELAGNWRGQKLIDGLPVIVTTIERDGVRYEVEQSAYPLNGPPAQRRGDIPMVLIQKLRLANLRNQPQSISIRMTHQRRLSAGAKVQTASSADGVFVCEESNSRGTLLSIQAAGLAVDASSRSAESKDGAATTTTELTTSLTLQAGAGREIIVKLPSPVVLPADRQQLLSIDCAAAREATVRFWSDYLARGARFRVPEPAVNELFRANLWHALRLPRRHGGAAADTKIDLPYSNFAYAQNGIPWPVNQAVYVDYMLYDLRGHHAISAEELLAMYRENQEPSGHVKGYANWGVYTPGMVYASAKHYLLSGGRAAFDNLLAPTLKAADWCLSQIAAAEKKSDRAGGLVQGPLNDGTGEGVWAFNQAYLFASLEILGEALARAGHPRAEEFSKAAGAFRERIDKAFRAASMRSPLVQMRDHTWAPYVPCEAISPGRRMDQWYPTDVDTGAMHLPRLRAISPEGPLATFLLNDHEDNLYLKGWGMANEPVYNPQASVYLWRDDPKAVIRAFYSYMACAFSHSVFEPVEHRWTHGQYFGPPSTDGAWFELYRNMLIQEREGDVLLLLAATPRKWLGDAKRIEVERAPTYYGPISMSIESHAASGTISADIQMPQRGRPKLLLLRLRHPEAKPMRSVMIDGQQSPDFDVEKEWVRIANPAPRRYSVVVGY